MATVLTEKPAETMSPSPTVVDVLETARALIGQGWTTGTYTQPKTNGEDGYDYCAMGAIVHAAMLHGATSNMQGALEEEATRALLTEIAGDDEHRMWDTAVMAVAVTEWNDQVDETSRSQREVLGVFDRAIETLKEDS